MCSLRHLREKFERRIPVWRTTLVSLAFVRNDFNRIEAGEFHRKVPKDRNLLKMRHESSSSIFESTLVEVRK